MLIFCYSLKTKGSSINKRLFSRGNTLNLQRLEKVLLSVPFFKAQNNL